MRILVVHNQLWAHYKSKLFEEINASLATRYPNAVFKVAQIGLYESARKNMQSSETAAFNYPYEVLFQKSLDEIGFIERLKALMTSFSRFKPDVLNVTGYYDWAQVALMLYARIRGVRVVLSSESSASDHSRGGIRELIKRWIVGRAQAFFCFGTTSAEYLKKLGVPENRITVRNAAVIDDVRIKAVYDAARTTQNLNTRNFIFVGRFSQEKNLLTLLKAYGEIRKHQPNPWGLLMVGDGPQREDLQNFVETEQIQGVTFSGGVSWLDVPTWLAQSRVLILPSYSEPWGLVVNEALVCGIPVIVSEKCGCTTDLVIPGKTGFTFAPDNTEELIRHMTDFMNLSDHGYEDFSRTGQKIVSKFAANQVAGEMVDTFISLANRK